MFRPKTIGEQATQAHREYITGTVGGETFIKEYAKIR